MGSFEPVFEYVALVIDLVGISMILWGISLSFKDWLILEMRKGETISFFQGTSQIRCRLGTYLLMGLEFMIASDIMAGFTDQAQFEIVLDRREAIEKALHER